MNNNIEQWTGKKQTGWVGKIIGEIGNFKKITFFIEESMEYISLS